MSDGPDRADGAQDGGDKASAADAPGRTTGAGSARSGLGRRAPRQAADTAPADLSGLDELAVDTAGAASGVETDGLADTEGEPDDSERATASVGATAVSSASSAGSARAAARRSGVTRAGSTPAKGVATRTRDDDRDDRGSLFARLGRFFREVVAELRKVIWPARNQMVTYTIVVIIFVVFMVALVAGLDVLFARGVLSIFG